MKLNKLLVFFDKEKISDIKYQVDKDSTLSVLGYNIALNKKTRKLILKPRQSLIDSNYTPKIIKNRLSTNDIDDNYLSNVLNSDNAKAVTQAKLPLSIKIDDTPLSQITKTLSSKLKHEASIPQKNQTLKSINEKIYLEQLYNKNQSFMDLFIVNFNFENLQNVISNLKKQGDSNSLDSMINRLVVLNEVYKFPFDKMVNLLETSGDIQKTKDYLLWEYTRQVSEQKVLHKLYLISKKYGIYLIELWSLAELIKIDRNKYINEYEELLRVLKSLNIFYEPIKSFTQLSDFNVNREVLLVSHVCNKILEDASISLKPTSFDASRVIVVGMHQGTGGSPQKAMRLASCLNNYTDKNVTYISPSLAPNGSAIQNTELVNSVSDIIVLDDISAETNESFNGYGISEDYLNRLYPKYRKNSIIKFIKVFDEIRPEVLHVIGTLELEIQAAIAAIIVGIPKIVLNPGMMNPTEYAVTSQHILECNFNKDILLNILKYDNVKLYNNSYISANSFDKWLGLNSTDSLCKTGVLYNGIHIPDQSIEVNKVEALRNQLMVSKNDLLVGIVGRLAYEKLPFNVLEAIKIISKKRTDIKFVFIGDGVLRESMEYFIHNNGLENQVSIFGFTSDMPIMYSAMDLCVLISLAEGMPNVLLEAQSFGVPVLTSDVGGCCETIIERVTGSTLQNNNPQTIAKGILKIFNDRLFMESSSVEAKKWIKENFSMPKMVENATDIYNQY